MSNRSTSYKQTSISEPSVTTSSASAEFVGAFAAEGEGHVELNNRNTTANIYLGETTASSTPTATSTNYRSKTAPYVKKETSILQTFRGWVDTRARTQSKAQGLLDEIRSVLTDPSLTDCLNDLLQDSKISVKFGQFEIEAHVNEHEELLEVLEDLTADYNRLIEKEISTFQNLWKKKKPQELLLRVSKLKRRADRLSDLLHARSKSSKTASQLKTIKAEAAKKNDSQTPPSDTPGSSAHLVRSASEPPGTSIPHDSTSLTPFPENSISRRPTSTAPSTSTVSSLDTASDTPLLPLQDAPPSLRTTNLESVVRIERVETPITLTAGAQSPVTPISEDDEESIPPPASSTRGPQPGGNAVRPPLRRPPERRRPVYQGPVYKPPNGGWTEEVVVEIGLKPDSETTDQPPQGGSWLNPINMATALVNVARQLRRETKPTTSPV